MIAWFVRNAIAANLLMIFIIVAGLFALGELSLSSRPDEPVNYLSLSLEHDAKNARENENKLVLPIEAAIKSVPGIDEIYSGATKTGVSFDIRLDTRFPMETTLEILQEKIAGLTELPESVQNQLHIKPGEYSERVLSIVVSTDLESDDLDAYVNDLHDALSGLSGISSMMVSGLQEPVVNILLNKALALQYDLNFSDIDKALSNLPDGIVTGPSQDIAALNELVVHTNDEGDFLTLGELAEIKQVYREDFTRIRLNGVAAARIDIYRSERGNAFEIGRDVAAFLADYSTPADQYFTTLVVDNVSRSLETRLGLLVHNIIIGAAILFVIMALFLHIRIAFWGFVGIVVAFAGALAVMYALDLSINAFSIFGFIIALGLVVDDAIVTGESIHYELRPRPGLDPIQATIKGTKKIAGPVTFSMITTIVAMLPLMFIDSSFQHYFYQIPIVVIPILVFSLIESKLILPNHLKTMHRAEVGRAGKGEGARTSGQALSIQELSGQVRPGPVRATKRGVFQSVKRRFTMWLDLVSGQYYPPALAWVLRHRHILLACTFGGFLVVIALFYSGWITFGYFDDVVDTDVEATVHLPTSQFDRQSLRTEGEQLLEKAALSLRARYSEEYGVDIIEHVVTTSRFYGAKITLKMAPVEHYREFITLAKIQSDWAKLLPAMPEGVQVRIGDESITEKEVIWQRKSDYGRTAVFIESESRERIDRAEQALRRDIQDSNVFHVDEKQRGRFGRRRGTVGISLTPFAVAMGFTKADLERQISRYLSQAHGVSFRMGERRFSAKIAWASSVPRDALDLVRFNYTDEKGQQFPLSKLVRWRGVNEARVLERHQYQAAKYLSVSYDRNAIEPAAASEQLREKVAALEARFPGVTLNLFGSYYEKGDAVSSALALTLLALFVIYILLAVPLGSYFQPLAILVTLPFCFMGALLGHVLLGVEFGFMSLLGVVAALGVAVNDSLIFVYEMNYIRSLKPLEQGGQFDHLLTLENALKRTGHARFKVVFLTSLSTFGSLVPLIFTQSAESKMLVPMAISLGFGVLFASFLTLFMLPTLFMVTDEFIKYLGFLKENLMYGSLEGAPIHHAKRAVDATVMAPATVHLKSDVLQADETEH